MATYVLVHGAHGGGWSWRAVARELQAAGHEAFTPTLTGLGERVHLRNPEIDLDTHVLDVVNVLHYERLENVVLVGHSYGGMVISGVADRAPERIERLVYLDAFAPRDGESCADLCGADLVTAFEEIARAHGNGWRYPAPPDSPGADRDTDMLVAPALQPLTFDDPRARLLKRTYVHFTAKPPDHWTKPIFERMAARVRQEEGWEYREAPFDHTPLFEHPGEVARLLSELA